MTPPLRVTVDGKHWVFDQPDEVVVGREPGCEVLVTDPLVSRRHLRVMPRDGRWWISDESSNGSFTDDGFRVGSAPVAAPLSLRLGTPDSSVRVVLETLAPAASLRSVEPDGTTSTRYVPAGVRAESVVGPGHRTVQVGRDRGCDVVVADLLASRRHCELRVGPGGGAEVVDLGSANGTFLNGGRVTGSMPLREGDVLLIGGTELVYRAGGLVQAVAGQQVLAAIGATVRTGSGKVLLDRVSLTVDAGELVAVAGPSGAGKSTMIGVLTGSRAADEGSVLVEGWNLAEHHSALHDRIGYVPQDDVVHRVLTVREVLDYAARLRLAADVTAAERASRIIEVLESLGLTPNAEQRVSTLSGGQRKRVNIAIELLARPRLLVLDEPTSGLDPGTDHNLMVLLRGLSERGQAIVVVTHSLAAIEACDRVVFIRVGGRLAYDGAPDRAPAAFGAVDLTGVYDALNLAADSVPAAPAWRPTLPRQGTPSATPVQTSLSQLAILTRRYVACLLADRRNLLILLLQAPIIGLLTRTLVDPDGLAVGQTTINTGVSRVLLTLVLSITWLGGTNGIREIVKELPIYQRERGAGVAIPAYLGSKFLVLGVVTVAQAFVLVTVALVGFPMPETGALLPNGTVELVLDIALAGIGSLALALLVSALTTNADKALTILPLLLVPQMILSGGLIDLAGKPVLQVLSPLATARWGYSASASTVDIATISSTVVAPPPVDPTVPPVPPPEMTIDRFWESDALTWLFDVGMLVALTAAFLALAGFALRWRDPQRGGPSAPSAG